MKKFIFLLIALLISVFSAEDAFAQKGSKIFKNTLKEADMLFETDDYKNALVKYMSIWKYDSLNEKINLNVAICRYKMKELPDSILPYLLKVDRSKKAEAQFYEAKLFHLKHNFAEAVTHYEKYKLFPEKDREIKDEEIDRLIAISKRANEMMSHPHKAAIKNVGKTINTHFPEYVPLVSLDETVLFFTSRRPGSTGNKTDAWGNYYEDIYVSYFKNEKWSEPKNLGSPLNTDNHDACVSLSADMQQMIIYRTSPDGRSGDLYVSRATFDGWEAPEKMGPEINTENKEQSACMNADNTVIYFSSDKPDGYGGKDLYRVVRLPNGKWSLPWNLGPAINTSFDEDAPFLHIDGKTLYFSSNGHNTMGEYDVFRTVLMEDNQYSAPMNLGYPINTVGDDIFLVLSADGRHGYYSSLNENPKEPGYESEDIYFIDMRYGEEEVRVRKAITFNNSEGDKPIQAKVTVINTDNNKVEGVYTPNQYTGKFVFIVNPYTSYKIVAEAKGFDTKVIEIQPMVEDALDEEPELKIPLKKL